jgi:hypothetical protein
MSVTSDPKLKYALPMENEIRVTYPFSNLYFAFPTKPYEGNEIYFPAYIKKVQDTVSPEYTQTHVFGRSDPVATYKKTGRKITAEFDMPAYSEYDANEILKKINILIKNAYPGYLETQGQSILNSPPLMRLKFANIICNPFNNDEGLLGFSEGINIGHSFSDLGTFIVPTPERDEGYLFVKSYSLSITFTVLHEQVVGWDDQNKNFKADNYPYKTIGEQSIPTSAKIGTSISNLRGSVTQDPATAKGLTLIFGA